MSFLSSHTLSNGEISISSTWMRGNSLAVRVPITMSYIALMKGQIASECTVIQGLVAVGDDWERIQESLLNPPPFLSNALTILYEVCRTKLQIHDTAYIYLIYLYVVSLSTAFERQIKGEKLPIIGREHAIQKLLSLQACIWLSPFILWFIPQSVLIF